MIPCEKLIEQFELMNHDGYIPKTSGTIWTAEKQAMAAESNKQIRKYGSKWVGHYVEDCSGAFVRAYRYFHHSIYQGSNRIAREYVKELLPIDKAEPGMAAFKFYPPGHPNYKLPSEYKKGGAHYNGDLNDYYHIGLVGRGLNILNSQSIQTGFVSSPIDKWHCVARLKDVDYNGGSMEELDAKTYAKNGGIINLRDKPDLDHSRVIYQVPNKSTIYVLDESDPAFYKVRYKEHIGYMVKGFVVFNDFITLSISEQCAKELFEALNEKLIK